MKKQKLRDFLSLGRANCIFFEMLLLSGSFKSDKIDNIVFFNSLENRKDICAKLKTSSASYMGHLSTLVKKRFVYKSSRGHYILDYELSKKLLNIIE